MTSGKFKLTRVSNQPVDDAELLTDLKRVAEVLGSSKLTQLKYREYGQYDDTTIARRFGSWNNALLKADLSVSNDFNISDERLFDNVLTLWQHYGRQPRLSELAKPPSTVSQSPYKRRFGSWIAALESFVEYVNADGIEAPSMLEKGKVQQTGRDPSLRLRWRILERDRFSCCACGASPALMSGVKLHVDHIVPWSKGGETILGNLQTLCAVCNLGKSNEHTG